jgi:predicted anti-sigma-YlaC factor YlaD
MCDQYAELFTAYLDRSLPAHIERDVAEHLESCANCHDRLEDMKSLVIDLERLGTVEASPEMAWAIKRAVRREARREAEVLLLKPVPFLISAAAAAVLLVAISLPGEQVGPPLESGTSTGDELILSDSAQLEHFVLPPRLGEQYQSAAPYATASVTDSASTREPSRVLGLPVRF